MSDLGAVLLVVGLLADNAFFVAAEFALISARRSSIEPRAEEGSAAARRTLRAMEQVSLMMAGAQLGITVCSLALGAVGEPAIAHLLEVPFAAVGVPEALLHPVAFALALLLVVAAHVVIGEMVPKNLALAAPDRAALLLGTPLMLVVRVLRPVIVVLNALANAVLRLARVQPKDEVTSSFTRDEVAVMVTESARHGLLEEQESHLVLGALGFDELTVGAVLLPAADVVTLPADAPAAVVQETAARTGFSHFPVRGRDGAYAGYLHLRDCLELAGEPAPALRPMPTVDVDDALRPTLRRMQGEGMPLATVLRGGEVAGIVALDDVLEVLVSAGRRSS